MHNLKGVPQICCLNRLFVTNFVVANIFSQIFVWIDFIFRAEVTGFPQVRLFQFKFPVQYICLSIIKESLAQNIL